MEKDDTWKTVEDYAQIVINSSDSQNIDSWFIVYGDPSNMTVLTFSSRDVGGVTIETGSGTVGLTVSQRVLNKTFINYTGAVNITFNNLTYNFDMGSGNSFAFLIKEENYVSSSSGTTTSISKYACNTVGYMCLDSCGAGRILVNLDCGGITVCCRDKNDCEIGGGTCKSSCISGVEDVSAIYLGSGNYCNGGSGRICCVPKTATTG